MRIVGGKKQKEKHFIISGRHTYIQTNICFFLVFFAPSPYQNITFQNVTFQMQLSKCNFPNETLIVISQPGQVQDV